MFFFKKDKKQKDVNRASNLLSQNNDNDFLLKVVDSLSQNIDNVKKMLDNPSDLMIREFSLGDGGIKGALIFIDGLIDSTVITDNVLQNIFYLQNKFDDVPVAEILEKLRNEVVSTTNVKSAFTLDEIMFAVLSGDTAIFIDGLSEVLVIETKGWEQRNIEEPVSEVVVRGPREGFIENVMTNTVLVRRYIRDPNLRFESFIIGRRSKKTIVLAYVAGIINQTLVDEVKRRLKTIDVDTTSGEAGLIEEWIQDSFLSPFPQLDNTERPDKVAGALVQGRFAILVDGTPFVLIGPITLSNTFQSPEDYYNRWLVGSLIRIIRYISAFIAMFAPALYIALVSFHPGMIPSKLVFSIAGAREGVPVPAVIEALLMELTMEILREAGIRLPRPIGQTVGIVGGLVIGEAAVAAGIVSPIMVIVVALTAISTFAMPSYAMAISIRFLRFGFMLAASVLGLYGIIILYIMINIHIVNLKSFGVPYSTPFAPMFFGDWKDLILRVPYVMNTKRPESLQTEDKKRVNNGGGQK